MEKTGLVLRYFKTKREGRVEMSQECKELIILVVEDEVKARESLIY